MVIWRLPFIFQKVVLACVFGFSYQSWLLLRLRSICIKKKLLGSKQWQQSGKDYVLSTWNFGCVHTLGTDHLVGDHRGLWLILLLEFLDRQETLFSVLFPFFSPHTVTAVDSSSCRIWARQTSMHCLCPLPTLPESLCYLTAESSAVFSATTTSAATNSTSTPLALQPPP